MSSPSSSPSSSGSGDGIAPLPSLVSVEWLADALHLDPATTTSLTAPLPFVFDCSWYLPSANRDALSAAAFPPLSPPLLPTAVPRTALTTASRVLSPLLLVRSAEYDGGHIPTAMFFDVDYHADRSSPFPHMLPSPAEFSALMSALRVSNTSVIVCYDASSAFCASARLWWTFLALGHPPKLLHVLDGGYRQWALSHPGHIERSSGPSVPRSAPTSSFAHPAAPPYSAHLLPALVTDKAAILSALSSPTPPFLLDARDGRRFAGVDPEPRPAQHAGHIPGAVNLWHVDVQTVLREGGRQGFLERSELRQRLAEAGVPREDERGEGRAIVCYCGSGITAATLLFVLWELGWRRLSLYDASMAEWLNADNAPIERGTGGGA